MSRALKFLVVLAAAALFGAAPMAQAGVGVGVFVGFGPPPPRHEVIVARPAWGACWVRGHWAWRAHGGRYVWVPGYWVRGRPGYVWVQGRWHHRHEGWAYREGYWRRR